MTESEIVQWLRTRPREQATLLAARGALRAIPSYAISLRVNDVLVPTLRSAALAWCSILDENRSADFSGLMAAAHAPSKRAAHIALADAQEAQNGLSREETAEYSSARTEYMLDPAREALSRTLRPITSSADAACFAAISGDIRLFDGGATTTEVAIAPLWSTPRPDWVNEHWSALKAHLLALSANWSAWTEWYDARLKGEAINLDKELARALEISDEDWRTGILHVNSKILGIEQRFHTQPSQEPKQQAALPPQATPAPRFKTRPDGRIDVETTSDANKSAQELREHAIIKARRLASRLPEQSNDDRAEIRALATSIDLLLTADLSGEETSGVAIWSYSLSLKSRLNADRRRQRLTEQERERQEETTLPIGISEELHDLVVTLDRLAKDDLELRDTESYEPSAEELASARASLDAARPLAVSAISEDELITAKAAEVLRPIASNMPDVERGKADVISTKTMENFVIQAVHDAVVAANAAAGGENPTPESRGDFELIRTAIASLTTALDENTRTQQDTKRNELTVAITAGAAGNVIAAGTIAVVNQGNVALAWVLANAEAIAAFASASTSIAAVGVIALAIRRLLIPPNRY